MSACKGYCQKLHVHGHPFNVGLHKNTQGNESGKLSYLPKTRSQLTRSSFYQMYALTLYVEACDAYYDMVCRIIADI